MIHEYDPKEAGTVVNVKAAAALVQRQAEEEAAKEDSRPQTMTLDGSNIVSFPGFPYTFEAVNEQILVVVDLFKSGNECPTCKGKKRITHKCACVLLGRPGFRYSEEDLTFVGQSISPAAAAGRRELVCSECLGVKEQQEYTKTCPECNGAGARVILLAESKKRMQTGVVVSMGKKAQELADFTHGDRVLYGEHAGSMIPTKAGIMFMRMDWYQVWLKVKGAEDLGAFDFVIDAETPKF